MTTGADVSGLAAYGGLYNAGTQLVLFTAADTPVQIRLNTSMPLKNVTAASNALPMLVPGAYEIAYNILLNTSKVSTAAVGVRRDGTMIAQAWGSQARAVGDTTALSYDGRLSASVIVPLSGGDVLDLAISLVRVLPDGLDAAINGYANATRTGPAAFGQPALFTFPLMARPIRCQRGGRLQAVSFFSARSQSTTSIQSSM